MPVVLFTLNACNASKEDLEELSSEGEIIGVTGLINLKWEDFSAIDLAGNAELRGIAWQATYDDTPGTLSLTVNYPYLTTEQVKAKFENNQEIDGYEIQEPLVLRNYA